MEWKDKSFRYKKRVGLHKGSERLGKGNSKGGRINEIQDIKQDTSV